MPMLQEQIWGVDMSWFFIPLIHQKQELVAT